MKNLTILTLITFGFLLSSFAQTEAAKDFNWKIGYGSSKGLPNGRYIHNFFVEKQLVKWNKWSLLGEVSYFHSPEYWSVSKPDDPIPTVAVPTISDPSKIRLANLGLKMHREILTQGSFHIGIALGAMLGYGYIEREEILTTVTRLSGRGALNDLVFKDTNIASSQTGLQPVIPVQLIFTKDFKKFGLSLIPAYYHIGKSRGNAGVILSLNI